MPLQQYLQLPHSQETKQKKLAKLLPLPLYILFSQLAAAKEAFSDPLEVTITGRASEAEVFNRKMATQASQATRDEERDEEEEEERHASKRSRVDKQADSREETHPLVVDLKVTEELGGELGIFSLRFIYMPILRIVCVEDMSAPASDTSRLTSLFPGDTGLKSPNQANGFLSPILTFDIKRPYRWAQHLCGLDFLPSPSKDQIYGDEEGKALEWGMQQHQQQARVRTVLQALRTRLSARNALK
mmetsp:Transcript_12544/g.17138  ORF Transcript_12544/g.17138 Transcript_12544/m.17138 type:complete len:244 (-) Transcript_12544:986-1717(-)